MSNIKDRNNKRKILRITNSCIKVYILCSLILSNLYIISSIKLKSMLLLIPFMLNYTKYDTKIMLSNQAKREKIFE